MPAASPPIDQNRTVDADRLRRRLLGRALGAVAACATATFASATRAANVVRPWPANKAAPAFELPQLDGNAWRLADARGKVVLLNFWATWCEPCRLEMPSLATLARQRHDDGLVVCAVNYRESAEKIRAFLDPASTPLLLLRDADGDATSEWTPRVFPTTVLVGRDGRPVKSVIGELDWTTGEAAVLLRPLLAAPVPADRRRS